MSMQRLLTAFAVFGTFVGGRAGANDNVWSNAGGPYTWTHAVGNPNWTTYGNWFNGYDAAVFSNTGLGAITLGSDIQTRSIDFQGSYLIYGGGFTLSLANVGSGTLSLSEIRVLSGAAEIAAPVAGSVGLLKSGNGVLYLTGTNTYTGGTTVTGGELRIGNNTTIGSITGNVALNGGNLAFQRLNSYVFDGQISGSGTIYADFGVTILSADSPHTGAVFIASGATIQIGHDSGTGSLASSNIAIGSVGSLVFSRTGSFGFAGNINGGGQLYLYGGGTLSLTGDATHTGGTTIDSSTLSIGNGGTTGSLSGNVFLFNSSILQFNRSNDLTYTGVVNGSGSLVKLGSGTLTLSGVGSNYTAGTFVNAGTLQLGVGTAIPTGSNVTVAAGAQFNTSTLGNGPSNAIGTVTLNGGTFRVPSGSANYGINQLVMTGGTVDFTGAIAFYLQLTGTGASITINSGSSNWVGAGFSRVQNNTVNPLPITVNSGGYLNAGIILSSGGTNANFVKAGSGVLRLTNLSNTANVTVSAGVLTTNDLTSNAGVGTLGTGTFTLDGGVLAYDGATAATGKPITVTPNAGTIAMQNAGTTLTWNGAISGVGTLVKSGPGTLVLTNAGNTVNGLTINAGVVSTADDAALGAGPVTVYSFGTLRYTAGVNTSRTFNLLSGTIEAAGGATVTLNSAAVGGGFLRGTGTFALTGNTVISGATTFNSTSLNQIGPASLTNFTNGGAITNAAGQTLTWNGGVNQGSGRFIVNGTAYVSDFTTTGTVSITGAGNLLNTGTSPLVLGGGSVTTVGVYNPVNGQVTPGGTITIGAQDLVVQGGFLRNNGIVTGPGKLIVDYGGLAKGAGDYDTGGTVLRNGGVLLAGNSPGLLRVSNPSFTGGSTTGGDFNNATGTVGGFAAPANNNTNNSGWSAIEFGNSANTASGLTLQRAAAGAVKWQFRTTANDGIGDTPGNPANFSASAPFQWLIFRPRTNAGATNPTPTLPTDQINTVATITLLDTTGATLANTNANLNQVLAFDASLFRDPSTGLPISPSAGLFSFAFGADLIGRPGTTITLIFTPVPEPTVTFGFAGLMAFAAGHGLRRRGT
jgi:autotransporter-associated beta strand protein